MPQCFLLVLALQMLLKSKAPAAEEAVGRIDPRFIPLVGIVGGACMGLLGVGGGLLTVSAGGRWRTACPSKRCSGLLPGWFC